MNWDVYSNETTICYMNKSHKRVKWQADTKQLNCLNPKSRELPKLTYVVESSLTTIFDSDEKRRGWQWLQGTQMRLVVLVIFCPDSDAGYVDV